MLKTGTGEFAIVNTNRKGCLIFYRIRNKFYKDIFKDQECQTKNSIEISKEEYTRKLEQFLLILKGESNE